MPLLVIDDRPVLAAAFRDDGYDVVATSTSAGALHRLGRPDIDAILLALRIPGATDLLTTLRARGIHAPILAVSDRAARDSAVDTLELGADDFVRASIDYPELCARMRALVRRAAGPRWAPLGCNGLVFHDDSLSVSVRGNAVMLSPREHALLGYFLRHKGEALRRPAILKDVFGYTFETGTNLVNVHIAHLRRKLGISAVCIETMRGFGYRLRAAKEDDAEDGDAVPDWRDRARQLASAA
jgi:DNA-binding response OmpR family regulator